MFFVWTLFTKASSGMRQCNGYILITLLHAGFSINSILHPFCTTSDN
jgi:hypothetical protein